MKTQAKEAPFQHGGNSVAALMQLVIYALVPGIFASLWFFGVGILLNIIVAATFAVLAESLVLRLRGRNIRNALGDRSALLTALLFAIAMPPGAPWWLPTLGILFAIIVAKHVYGGLGQNLFNPAMCGYAMLLLAFPLEMTSWHLPGQATAGTLVLDALGTPVAASTDTPVDPLSWAGIQQSLLLVFPFAASATGELTNAIDGLALATPLIEFKMAGQSALLAARDSGASLLARESNTGWEIVNICYLLGGLYLLYRKVIAWHIPVAVIAAILAMSLLFYAPGSSAIYGTPYLHLFGSATMIGAFFIATDPVSAATTRPGRLVYGAIIGVAIYSIRVWGSYLDSIAFAVLFGNAFAPLIDHYCRPRIFGHRRRRGNTSIATGPEAGK